MKDVSYSGSSSVDSAICGTVAGFASTVCTHPLDRLKTIFQVSTTSSRSLGIYRTLRGIVRKEGLTGLYRGLGVNIAGNCASWGFYFLWYSVLKKQQGADLPGVQLNAGQHLFASATSGVITAFMTNPLWVVKTRMYTTSRTGTAAYRNTFDGLVRISRNEGLSGLYKGTVMAVVGVSNGAIQFMLYEELKRWAKERKLRRRTSEMEMVELSNVEYSLMSGAAKMFAIGLTYPYQVVRSRLQYQQLSIASVNIAQHQDRPYTSIRDVIRRTYATEGFAAFYKGLGANVIRILPGTCVTFVVYENCSAYLRRKALERADR